MIVLPMNDGERNVVLTWKPIIRKGKTPTAVVTCINNHSRVIADHKISNHGEVSPSVVCTAQGCTWHEYIRLEGWQRILVDKEQK